MVVMWRVISFLPKHNKIKSVSGVSKLVLLVSLPYGRIVRAVTRRNQTVLRPGARGPKGPGRRRGPERSERLLIGVSIFLTLRGGFEHWFNNGR